MLLLIKLGSNGKESGYECGPVFGYRRAVEDGGALFQLEFEFAGFIFIRMTF